ncbi:hypothetical protein OV090_18380 [Nannocystis sp. RBIL2]|uniref:hypothetical protein n=1 Tax=Nannocystis sp. RBIL2 TaxID=2996788 RepID=UPI00227160AC|nr:hypothetical protein [Nannocystis sp. RBIL2]MCY1066748.1 hypothetical protein [Nannocystis sp. RBIL2]
MANATADTPAQWLALLRDSSVDLIRSQSDWDNFVALPSNRRAAFFTGTPNAGVDPLANASPTAIRAFSASLKFAGGGLGHADYSSFVGVLSAAQFSALWGAFGISNVLIADYNDRYCRESGTCAAQGGSICTSNC